MSATKALIITSLVALGVFSTFMVSSAPKSQSAQGVSDVQIKRDLFEQWKVVYGKSYEIAEEEEKRFQVWSENYDFVQEHNKLPENTYTVGMNVYADISNAEWKALLANCIVDANATRQSVQSVPVPSNLPSSVDWRTKSAVTPIKNQQQCGSCWAFSTTGSLEGLAAINTGTLRSFSEQQLVDCSSSYGNQGCNGGLMDYAFQYVAANKIELESSYPYKAVDGTCKYSAAKAVFANTGYTDVPQQNNDALAAAVAVQPVSIAIEADTAAFQLYTGGVFNNAGCGTSLDHGVLIVGYSATGSSPYWIVKNSWGSSWGESGYIRIAKQTGSGPGICGLALSASYPTLSSEEVIGAPLPLPLPLPVPVEEPSQEFIILAEESEESEESTKESTEESTETPHLIFVAEESEESSEESEESSEESEESAEFSLVNLNIMGEEAEESIESYEISSIYDEVYGEEGSEEEGSGEEGSEEEGSEEEGSEEEGSEEEGSEEEGSEEFESIYEEVYGEEEGSEEEGSEEESTEDENLYEEILEEVIEELEEVIIKFQNEMAEEEFAQESA